MALRMGVPYVQDTVCIPVVSLGVNGAVASLLSFLVQEVRNSYIEVYSYILLNGVNLCSVV